MFSWKHTPNLPWKSYGDALVIKYYMHVLLSWTQINMLLIDPTVVNLQSVLSCHQKYHSFVRVFLCFSVCHYKNWRISLKVSIKWVSHLEILFCRKHIEHNCFLLPFYVFNFLSLNWTTGLYTYQQSILDNRNLTIVALVCCFLALKRDSLLRWTHSGVLLA